MIIVDAKRRKRQPTVSRMEDISTFSYNDTNAWSLTSIGKIDDVDAEEWRQALETGDVTVTLSLG